jgi:hypothetical protein
LLLSFPGFHNRFADQSRERLFAGLAAVSDVISLWAISKAVMPETDGSFSAQARGLSLFGETKYETTQMI